MSKLNNGRIIESHELPTLIGNLQVASVSTVTISEIERQVDYLMTP